MLVRSFVCLLSKQIKRELCETESERAKRRRKKSISCDAIWRYINRKKRGTNDDGDDNDDEDDEDDDDDDEVEKIRLLF